MSFPETVDEVLDVSEDEGRLSGLIIDKKKISCFSFDYSFSPLLY